MKANKSALVFKYKYPELAQESLKKRNLGLNSRYSSNTKQKTENVSLPNIKKLLRENLKESYDLPDLPQKKPTVTLSKMRPILINNRSTDRGSRTKNQSPHFTQQSSDHEQHPYYPEKLQLPAASLPQSQYALSGLQSRRLTEGFATDQNFEVLDDGSSEGNDYLDRNRGPNNHSSVINLLQQCPNIQDGPFKARTKLSVCSSQNLIKKGRNLNLYQDSSYDTNQWDPMNS